MMKKNQFFLNCLSLTFSCLLFCGVAYAQPSCSQADWCRHHVTIQNTSCCEVEIWCQENGCDGSDYFMGTVKPGQAFRGEPNAYGATFRVAYEGYYVYEFLQLEIDGYCYSYEFQYDGSNSCSQPVIYTSVDQTIHPGVWVEICASGADYYWWSTGEEQACIYVSPHQTTTYGVTGSKNGCTAYGETTVYVNQAVNVNTCNVSDIWLEEWSVGSTHAALAWTTYSNATYELYVRPAGSHEWYFFEMNQAYADLAQLTPCTTYEWAVSVKCSNGIVSDAWNARSFTTSGFCGGHKLADPTAITINQLSDVSSKNIHVYPNPATNLLSVDYTGLPIQQLAVYNSIGKLIEYVPVDESGITTIEVKDYTSGVYLITATANDKIIKNMFVVD